ncbi:MAG: GIY-YIG nuclease family protein [Planctomycetota bacterium]|jgi:hypothetical protein
MDLSEYRPVGAKGAYPQWLRDAKKYSGAYVIRCKKNKKPLYVGSSYSNLLYGTITRHFQTVGDWYNETGKEKPTYRRGRVEVAIVKTSPKQATEIEKVLICELDPRDNTYSKDCEKQEDEYEDEVPF